MPLRPRFALATALVVLVIGWAAPAAASSITFDFDCNITGPTCTSTTSIGTLTITDNGDSVDLLLALTGSVQPQQLNINYDGFPLPSGYSFTSSNGSVTVTQDALQADGYSIGLFDMQFPSTGNLNNSGNTFTTTLSLTDGSLFVNLDPSNFDSLSTDGQLYAAVLKTGGDSWFGASTCSGCSDDVTPTPEPASLLLFGGGLSALAYRLRRQKKSSDS